MKEIVATVPKKRRIMGIFSNNRIDEVSLQKFNEAEVGIRNHKPNEEGKESLAPWDPDSNRYISQFSLDQINNLRPTEDLALDGNDD